jgi:hypothetical protein
MKSKRIRVFIASAAAILIGICGAQPKAEQRKAAQAMTDAAAVAAAKGAKWLVSVQGADGGWGQDGGETSYVRAGERLETNGNDVANTAVAVEALIRLGNTPTSGEYRDAVVRGVRFILQNVEQSSGEGLAVTTRQGTQIQRKLGPYIDTFLTSKLLAQLDGHMGDTQFNARVRQSLQKCVAKIEKNQMKDGSWNLAGGWAPILGTSMASQSLDMARAKGVPVAPATMAKVTEYTKQAGAQSAGGVRSEASAGVSLYQKAQELEQLSRTAKDRKDNAREIDAIKDQLTESKFVSGYGSIGGEEFFSYLNISESLKRTGGPEWEKWHGNMKDKIVKLQNQDGTWAGHHCITGRVAVTSAAILTLLADRQPAVLSSAAKVR